MNTAAGVVNGLQFDYEAQKKPARRNEMKLSGWIFFVLNLRLDCPNDNSSAGREVQKVQLQIDENE